MTSKFDQFMRALAPHGVTDVAFVEEGVIVAVRDGRAYVCRYGTDDEELRFACGDDAFTVAIDAVAD